MERDTPFESMPKYETDPSKVSQCVRSDLPFGLARIAKSQFNGVSLDNEIAF